MKKVVLGAAVVGAAVLGLRAAVRHCRTIYREHCGQSTGQSCQCG